MDREQIKRYSLPEVALLGILLVGMATAWLIVKTRSGVVLTDPIALQGSGVTVRLPGGVGWEQARVYDSDSSIALLAQRRSERTTEAEVRWRYIVAGQPGSLEESLKQRLTGTPARVEMLEMPKGALMQAARILAPEQPTYYVAAAPLKYGRTIELQVIPKTLEYDLLFAEAVLRDTAMSLTYETPQELIAGKTLTEQFLQTMQGKTGAEEAYLIREGRGPTAGFFYARQEAGSQEGVRRIVNRHYDAQQFMIESTLQVGRGGQPLEWDTALTVAAAGTARSYQIRRPDQGALTVTSNYENAKTLYPEGAVLPEVLMTEFVQYWMAREAGTVVTDVLAATGVIVPVRLTRLAPEEATATAPEAVASVRVEYLHEDDFFDEFYFNSANELIGRFERQTRHSERLWEKTDVAALKERFGKELDPAVPRQAPGPRKFF